MVINWRSMPPPRLPKTKGKSWMLFGWRWHGSSLSCYFWLFLFFSLRSSKSIFSDRHCISRIPAIASSIRPFFFHHYCLMMTTRLHYHRDRVSSGSKSACKSIQRQNISCFSSALLRKRRVVGFLGRPMSNKILVSTCTFDFELLSQDILDGLNILSAAPTT